jgi:hypothetical protein
MKKLKKKIIQVYLSTAFGMIGLYSYGQKNSSFCANQFENDIPMAHLLCSFYKGSDPFHGKIGEMNQWGRGTVYLYTGDSVEGRFFVYNRLGSNLIWINEKSRNLLLVDKSTVKCFSIISDKDSVHRIYEYFPLSSLFYIDGEGAFLELLVKDIISLYVLNTIETIPISNNLVSHEYYFVHKADGTLVRTFLNRRSLCASLSNSKDFLKHLRKIGLKANNRGNLIKAVKEYNSFLKNRI